MPNPKWVRVKDRETHHEFDVPEGDPRIGVLLDLVKADRYPPAHYPRPPKHHLTVARSSAARSKPETSVDGKPASKENHDG